MRVGWEHRRNFGVLSGVLWHTEVGMKRLVLLILLLIATPSPSLLAQVAGA
jgi:hypothetical protein